MIKIHKYLQIFTILTISIYAEYYFPKPRIAHTSTLIDSKFYFIGGTEVGDKSALLTDFFYLDLKSSFSTNSGTLLFVSVNNFLPNAFCTIATINNTIYLIGGYINDQSSLVYQYDT